MPWWEQARFATVNFALAELRAMTDLIETLVENREMVQPNHANMLGTAHGGNVMKWMDEIE